ncbi:MAG: hypothetical protein R3B91_09615 [Planctomycetaceae bacterium]
MRLACGCSTDYEWVNITMNAEFAPRDGATLTYDGRMWFIGGWNSIGTYREFFPRICNNEVWSSRDGDDWTLVKPNTSTTSRSTQHRTGKVGTPPGTQSIGVHVDHRR